MPGHFGIETVVMAFIKPPLLVIRELYAVNPVSRVIAHICCRALAWARGLKRFVLATAQ